ncbi:MAG: hypothetical protein ACLFRL_01230 [Desulfohalobiaceae bacterium]
MGIGAALAAGCNIGGFYNAIGMFSMGGYAMMIGLGAGAFLGLKVLIWELSNIPQKAAGAPKPLNLQKKLWMDWSKLSPYLGGMILALVVAAFYIYSFGGQPKVGGCYSLGP